MIQLTAKQVSAELRAVANPKQAANLSWFFKTGKGEYGEGDVFLGIKVPQSRLVARKYSALPVSEIEKLSKSKYHEERFTAIVILVNQFKKAKTESEQKKLFNFYVKLIDQGAVNNWDLVDVSAPYMGEYLFSLPDPTKYLLKFGKKGYLWRERVSIMFTFPYIRIGNTEVAFQVVEKFLKHEHDLIHKAAGWMLREAGKRSVTGLRTFLSAHSSTMPRTMLRYAIEKLPEQERKRWLSQTTN
jgi:3-methyladenine DNA glycosylase AlkD